MERLECSERANVEVMLTSKAQVWQTIRTVL